jgi:hypothetical protein
MEGGSCKFLSTQAWLGLRADQGRGAPPQNGPLDQHFSHAAVAAGPQRHEDWGGAGRLSPTGGPGHLVQVHVQVWGVGRALPLPQTTLFLEPGLGAT